MAENRKKNGNISSTIQEQTRYEPPHLLSYVLLYSCGTWWVMVDRLVGAWVGCVGDWVRGYMGGGVVAVSDS